MVLSPLVDSAFGLLLKQPVRYSAPDSPELRSFGSLNGGGSSIMRVVIDLPPPPSGVRSWDLQTPVG